MIALAGSVVALGGQNCHAAEKGACTGDISAEMLKDAGCAYVIAGHSERRACGETDAMVNAKVAAAWRAGLVAILCVGETRAEREAGQEVAVVLQGSSPGRRRQPPPPLTSSSPTNRSGRSAPA